MESHTACWRIPAKIIIIIAIMWKTIFYSLNVVFPYPRKKLWKPRLKVKKFITSLTFVIPVIKKGVKICTLCFFPQFLFYFLKSWQIQPRKKFSIGTKPPQIIFASKFLMTLILCMHVNAHKFPDSSIFNYRHFIFQHGQLSPPFDSYGLKFWPTSAKIHFTVDHF